MGLGLLKPRELALTDVCPSSVERIVDAGCLDLLSITEVATGYAGKSQYGSGYYTSFRFMVRDKISHFTIFVLKAVLLSITI